MEQLPSTPAGALYLLANTQSQIDKFSDDLIQSVKEGEEDALKVLIYLKAMDKVSERVQKEIRENTLTAADKFPGTSFEFLGNKIEKAENGIKYDYLGTGDPVYRRLFDIQESAQEQVKEREAFLKALKAPLTFVDDDSGEVVTIHPPNKKSTTGLKITIR